MEACDMEHGRLMSDTTLPKLTVILKNSVSSTITLLASRLHGHSNLRRHVSQGSSG